VEDEGSENRPKVSLVPLASPLAGGAPGLAGEAGGDEPFEPFEAGEPDGEGPAPDPGEVVFLPAAFDFFGRDLFDPSAIDVSFGKFSGLDEILQPPHTVRVAVIVENAHVHRPFLAQAGGPSAAVS
jgi:hypothetical protein